MFDRFGNWLSFATRTEAGAHGPQAVFTETAVGTPSFNNIAGDNDDNILIGGARLDRIQGYGGNDTMMSFGGRDYLNGGEGSDDLYAGAGDDLLVGDDGWDVVRGMQGGDLMLGNHGNDFLGGGLGVNDVMYGGVGGDLLKSAGHRDIMTGGDLSYSSTGDGETDVFFFAHRSAGLAVITDFEVGIDLIDLSRVANSIDDVTVTENTVYKGTVVTVDDLHIWIPNLEPEELPIDQLVF